MNLVIFIIYIYLKCNVLHVTFRLSFKDWSNVGYKRPLSFTEIFFWVYVCQYPPAFHLILAIKYFLQISNEQNHKHNAFCRILTAIENNIDKHQFLK